jgi:hypothetical protein
MEKCETSDDPFFLKDETMKKYETMKKDEMMKKYETMKKDDTDEKHTPPTFFEAVEADLSDFIPTFEERRW